MANKKIWKMWTLLLKGGFRNLPTTEGNNQQLRIHRYDDGYVGIGTYELSPREARRLFQQLKKDYDA